MSVSIIIPCRQEEYPVSPGISILQRTIQDIYEKAVVDFEVIVAFDGEPYQELPKQSNVAVLKMPWAGRRIAFNRAAKIATGEYLFKVDAHCMFDHGFDVKLQAGMKDNWIMMPRFYVLDGERWQWQDDRFYDYFYLPCPYSYKRGFMFQAGGHWQERTKERLDVYPWDENMKLHGSAFFLSREFYWHCLGGLAEGSGAGTWNGEDIELSMKTWLGPWNGRVMVNKSTWYAHMHRGGQRPREWKVDYKEAYRSAEWSAHYWMGNKWEGRKHDIDWLIDRFWPVPGWPDDWHERLIA